MNDSIRIPKVKCNKYGKDFLIGDLEEFTMHIGKGKSKKKIYIKSFKCPHCNNNYFVNAENDRTKYLLKQALRQYEQYLKFKNKNEALATRYFERYNELQDSRKSMCDKLLKEVQK